MSDRLPSHLFVSAMLRRANDSGGMGMVLAKGDAQAGAILAVTIEPGGAERLFERGFDRLGRVAIVESTPAEDVADYWRRRRSRDPDLWVIELDIASPERFAAETILAS